MQSPSAPLALAPAAGAGIGKVIAERLTRDPEFVPAMIEAAMGGLRAERTVWEKSSDGKSNVSTTEPDHKTRIATFFGLLAHMEGEPIKRQIVQHIGADGSPLNPEAALTESPALLRAARHLVAKVEAQQRRKNGEDGPRTGGKRPSSGRSQPVEVVVED